MGGKPTAATLLFENSAATGSIRLSAAAAPALRPLLDRTQDACKPACPASASAGRGRSPISTCPKAVSLFQSEFGGSKYFHWTDSFPPFCQLSLL